MDTSASPNQTCIAAADGAPGADFKFCLTLNEVIAATRRARTSLYKMRRNGTFPQPTDRRGRQVLWRADMIVDWIVSNPSSNLGRLSTHKPRYDADPPDGYLIGVWKNLIWERFVPKRATHFITVNLGNPGSASEFNRKWAPECRRIARRFINILGRLLFGKTGWNNPLNKSRLDFYVRLETVPRNMSEGPEKHLHLHAMIDLAGTFPAGSFSALADEFKAKLQASFGAEAFGFRVSTKIQYILNEDHRLDLADYLSKKVWLDADRIFNRENL